MKVARVLGNVVATVHHPTYDGHKIMVVRPEGPGGEAAGKSKSYLAVDLVQAGPGDRVLVLTEGNGVRQLLGSDAGPIRSVIVGIVDHVDS
jgi:ethanolamine utilization protein EutN